MHKPMVREFRESLSLCVRSACRQTRDPLRGASFCRQIEDFVRFAPQIGSYLGWRGRPFVLIDSKGPISGLPGKYFDGIASKYYKGPVSPRLGDLAYTELAMLPRLFSSAMM